MDRVKNIEEVIIGEGEVLVEMVEKVRKSGIVLPDSTMSDDMSSNYGVIVAIGSSVNDVEVGDIVLKTRTEKAPGYPYKGKTLAMFSRYNIAVAIKPANFDNTVELSA